MNERILEVWVTFANRPEAGLLYKMLRQGTEKEVAWWNRIKEERPDLF